MRDSTVRRCLIANNHEVASPDIPVIALRRVSKRTQRSYSHTVDASLDLDIGKCIHPRDLRVISRFDLRAVREPAKPPRPPGRVVVIFPRELSHGTSDEVEFVVVIWIKDGSVPFVVLCTN